MNDPSLLPPLPVPTPCPSIALFPPVQLFMHALFPPFGSKLKNPSRKNLAGYSISPSSLSLSFSLQLSFDAPQDVPTTRSNSNSSSFQTWNIWIQILEILNSKYRGGRAKWRGGEKMDAKVIRFDIPDGRRKIKFQFEFPYLPIYIYTYILDVDRINSLFSLLAWRLGEEDRQPNKLHVSIRYLWCTSAALA